VVLYPVRRTVRVSKQLLGIWLLGASVIAAQPGRPANSERGPAVGTRVPEFEAVDQNGTRQNLASITGPKGAVLVFYRSADW
jgi:hypothetical protein